MPTCSQSYERISCYVVPRFTGTPCDRVGGTVKRLAARASLQRPYDDQLQTPFQLFEWAKENIPTVVFEFVSTEEVMEEESIIADRLENSRTTVIGIFRPLDLI